MNKREIRSRFSLFGRLRLERAFNLLLYGLLAGPVWFCVFAPLLAQPSNCGGNTAALGACKMYIVNARFAAFDNGGDVFNIDMDPESEIEWMLEMLRSRSDTWMGDAGFYVRTGDVVVGKHAPRTILVIGGKPFRNVPQRRFGCAPATYAVGYADGEIDLITPAEFASLDLSRFRSIAEWESARAAEEKAVSQ